MRRAIPFVTFAAMAFVLEDVHAFRLADDLAGLVGYIIVGSEHIDEFEGCEYGKRIDFSSGGHVTCQEYGYAYGYYTPATILARPMSARGMSGFACKMAVDDTLYDIDCSAYMSGQISLYRNLADQPKYADYARFWLGLLGVE